jgi:two-component system, NarL family, sensor histidine kinase UhpB
MSLRFRLNILITATFVAMLLLGTTVVIYDARRAVSAEIESTAGLAIQLLEIAVAGAEPLQQEELRNHLLRRIGAFDSARHLHMILREGDRELSLANPPAGSDAAAPAWFVRLVQPEPMEFTRPLSGTRTPYTEIVVRADPADEMAEAWKSARDVLGLLLLFSIIANGLLWFTIGRWLRPVESIVAALEGIEHGNFSARLPKFALPELTSVAAKVNHLGEALERSREENRYLAQQSLEIQEAERRLLARELHDELGQSISAINAVAAAMTDERQHASAGVTDPAAGTIAEISSHIYTVLRRMLRRLRPVVLDEFGLVAALGELVDGWNERHPEAFCRLATRGRLDDIGGDAVNIHLYRIVQECLTNVSRHARASEVTVELERTSGPQGDFVRLSVRDNGTGFEQGSRRGLGLLGMQERVEALKGSMKLTAAPDEGTRVDIGIPLQEAAAERGRAA